MRIVNRSISHKKKLECFMVIKRTLDSYKSLKFSEWVVLFLPWRFGHFLHFTSPSKHQFRTWSRNFARGVNRSNSRCLVVIPKNVGTNPISEIFLKCLLKIQGWSIVHRKPYSTHFSVYWNWIDLSSEYQYSFTPPLLEHWSITWWIYSFPIWRHIITPNRI